jgi:hypothetical protein
MPSSARPPSDHLLDAERLLGVAESPSVDPALRDLAAQLATAHALLCLAPRRVSRQALIGDDAPVLGAGSVTERWLRGDHDNGADG